jgi:hypothetical protein
MARRKAIVDFLGLAIFRDRQHGAELATRVYADSPMPEIEFEQPSDGGPLTAKLLAHAPRPEIWNKDAKEKTK